MNAANQVLTPEQATTTTLDSANQVQYVAQSTEPNVLVDIYQDNTNMVVWQRSLPNNLKHSINDFLNSNPRFQSSMTVTPTSVLSRIREVLRDDKQGPLCENIAELVDMFCTLFELERAGLRLTVLDRAMCPRFHVDQVPCRLVTTFQGTATQWLHHQTVDREKLGAGSNGKSDSESGLYTSPADIQQLNSGDVALLKGERWEGNENAGLVHRSPALTAGERRLIMTLDFSD